MTTQGEHDRGGPHAKRASVTPAGREGGRPTRGVGPGALPRLPQRVHDEHAGARRAPKVPAIGEAKDKGVGTAREGGGRALTAGETGEALYGEVGTPWRGPLSALRERW